MYSIKKEDLEIISVPGGYFEIRIKDLFIMPEMILWMAEGRGPLFTLRSPNNSIRTAEIEGPEADKLRNEFIDGKIPVESTRAGEEVLEDINNTLKSLN